MLVPEGQHYSNAPIHEAIIEFVVSGVDPARVSDLETVVGIDGFPNRGPEYDLTAEMGFEGEEVVSNASRRLLGYRGIRDDGRRVIRAHTDRFAFSWLRPYDRWESFVDEAIGHWATYRSVAGPLEVDRIGVRFVNRIDVTRSSVEITDYLRTSVDISPYLPQLLSGFFFQIEIPLVQHNASTRVISTLVQPEHPNSTLLVLDLDTWRSVSIKMDEAANDDVIRENLKELRILKNYVFEACITDATRGLIA